MKKLLRNKYKNEHGNLTIFVLFIMLGVILLFGLFFNIAITYMNVSFSKKALDEATRSRAMAVDVPLKESIGVVEVINYPHSGSDNVEPLYRPADRPLVDFLGNVMPCNGFGQCGVGESYVASEYKEAVDYAELYAKNNMIMALDSYTGKDSGGKQPLVEFKKENICFDVQPLPKEEGDVTFACALKTLSGEVFTITKTVRVMGYNDGELINEFNDDTLTGDNTFIRVNNVVFGAAVIEPRALYKHPLYRFGYMPEKTRTFLYSIAYPQIDRCYGEFC